jgi:hypothetical protein
MGLSEAGPLAPAFEDSLIQIKAPPCVLVVVSDNMLEEDLAQHPEHAPGEAAPVAGTYEQLNIFGRPTGIRVNVRHGHPLPSAPLGHNWTLAEDDMTEC